MKYRKTIILIGSVLFLWMWVVIYSSGGPKMFYNWFTIGAGDTKVQVFKKLGKPYMETEEFKFWVMVPHEQNAKDSGAISYAMWDTSWDTIYVIGFDKDDRVSYKIHGGS